MANHLLAAILLLTPGDAPASDNLPKLNVVLFTPADVAPPRGYEQRLTEVADYTEAFIVGWMKRWEYPPQRERIFERKADGTVRVLHIRGKHNLASGKYSKPSFAPEIWNTAVPKYKLGRHQHVWWVWVYLGGPPQRFSNFVGSGDVKGGGTAFLNYPALAGKISLRDDLGTPLLTELAMKGCIHELGHAFGLPHNGPVVRQNLGMPLMGANIPNYRRRTKSKDPRAYLTRASAAMLWKHPIFTGNTNRRGEMPQFRVSSLKSNRDDNAVHITGGVTSDIPPHSIVIMDSVPKRQEAYWQKSYAARIDEQGRFDVAISEPTQASGKLRILFCFENGAITGDGKKYGIPSAMERPYVGTSTSGYRLGAGH